MLPGGWEKRLVDLNVRKLSDADLAWADVAFVSAMAVQRESARDVLARCRAAGLVTVAGGPLFTTEPEAFEGEADHLVLGEAEQTLPQFLADWVRGEAESGVQGGGASANGADAGAGVGAGGPAQRTTRMAVQFSRGCPFDCDFCNITALLGRRVRDQDCGADRRGAGRALRRRLAAVRLLRR